jgi:hypothetical protein
MPNVWGNSVRTDFHNRTISPRKQNNRVYREHAKAKSDAMRKRNEANLGQREARLEKEKVAELASMEEKLPESEERKSTRAT